MGPMQALVALGRAFAENLDTFTSTEKAPFVACDLRSDGSAQFVVLPVGTQIRGCPTYARSGLNYVPRPFRDTFDYTCEAGPKRQAYRAAIEPMAAAHPKSKPLRALLAFLDRKPSVPGKIRELVKKHPATSFVPRYAGRLIFAEVAADFAQGNPYACLIGREQTDVVTGEPGVVPRPRPIRIRGLGASKGTTLMSIDDPTTLSHFGGKDRHLRVPVSERTMNLHVVGLQALIDAKAFVRICEPLGSDHDGVVACFAWTTSARGVASNNDFGVLDLVRGRAKLQEVVENAASMLKSKGTLCVLGLREGARLQYAAWHFLPLAEAAMHLISYANRFHRADGSVIGARDVARACVPLDLAVSDSGYHESELDTFTGRFCPPSFLVALLGHMIEGSAFPSVLRNRVRHAYASQNAHRDRELAKRFATAMGRQLENQEVLESMS